MTFEESYENIMKQQDHMKESLNNISKGIYALQMENEHLKIENEVLRNKIEDLEKEKKRLQELIVILTTSKKESKS